MHPDALVTVNEYVPGISEVIFLVDPEPVTTVPSEILNDQLPVTGNPFIVILPDGVRHVG